MTDTPVEIPDRAAFRAAEVCEIAQIPPYVLRSWEKEFPGLGATARPGGPRIYRRLDVEQILRIKQLVFAEGLTLAGVRHRIEGEPVEEHEIPIEAAPPVETVSAEVRSRVSHAKRELRELLDMLIGEAPAAEAPPIAAAPSVAAPAAGDTALPAPPCAMPQDESALAADDLPLLDGVLDTPPKAKRVRRTTKQAPWGPTSEVE